MNYENKELCTRSSLRVKNNIMCRKCGNIIDDDQFYVHPTHAVQTGYERNIYKNKEEFFLGNHIFSHIKCD